MAKAAVRSKAVVLLFLTFCLLLLPSLWESVINLCFVVRYFMSILVLLSSWWGRESWLLCLICLPGVSWWFSGSSSRCHGVVCGLWLWYFLIILTIFKTIHNRRRSVNKLHDLETWRFQYASTMFPLRSCHMLLLRSHYDNEDPPMHSLRYWPFSYAFVAILCPIYIKFEVKLVYVQLIVIIQRKWIEALK